MSQGVHSGVFRVHDHGRAPQRELLVIGPDVTRTLEMETAANAGEILVSPETASQIPVDALGRVKGEGILVRRAPPSSPPPELPPPRSRRGEIELLIPARLRARLTGEHDEPEHRHVTIGFVHFGATDDVFEQLGAEELAARLASSHGSSRNKPRAYDICLLATDVAGGGGKFILTAGAPDAGADGEGRMLRTVLAHPRRRATAPGAGRRALRAGVRGRRRFTDATHVHGHGRRGEPCRPPDGARRTGHMCREPNRARGRTHRVRRTPARTVLREGQAPAGRRVPSARRPRNRAVPAAPRPARSSAGGTSSRCCERRLDAARRRARLGDRARRRHRCRQEPPGVGARDAARRHARAATALRTVPERPCVLRVEPHPARGLRHPERLGLARLRACSSGNASSRSRPRCCRGCRSSRRPPARNVEPTRAVDQLAPQFRTDRLHEAVATTVGSVLDQPTALVIDDAAWMDDASAALYTSLFRQVATVPWLICLTTRTTERGLRSELGYDAERVHLEPLGIDAALELATDASANDPLPDHVLVDIADALARQPDVRARARRRRPTRRVARRAADDARGRARRPDRRALAARPPSAAVRRRARLVVRHDAGRGRARRRAPGRGRAGVAAARPLPRADARTASASATSSCAAWRTRRCPSPAGARCTRTRRPCSSRRAAPKSRTCCRCTTRRPAGSAPRGRTPASPAIRPGRASRTSKPRPSTSARSSPPRRRRSPTRTSRRSRSRSATSASCSAATGRRSPRTRSRGVASATTTPRTRACSARPARSRSAPGATAPRSVGTAAASTRRRVVPGAPDVAQAMMAIASVRYWQGRFEECITWCREAISEAERTGDRNALGHAYHLLHLTYTDLNDEAALRPARPCAADLRGARRPAGAGQRADEPRNRLRAAGRVGRRVGGLGARP